MRIKGTLPNDYQTQLHYSTDSGRVLEVPGVDDSGREITVEARYNVKLRAWSVAKKRPALTMEETKEALRSLYAHIGRALTVEVARGVAGEIVSEAALTDEQTKELREWYRILEHETVEGDSETDVS